MRKTIHFVRHGEAEGNVTRTFQTPEIPLTERGHKQAAHAAPFVAALKPEVLIESGMVRARQTAEPIAVATGLVIETDPSWREVKQASSMWGKFRYGEEFDAYLEASRAAYIGEAERFEDAETYSDLQTRITAGLTTLETRPETTFAIVTHGAFLKSFLTHVLYGGKATGVIDLDARKRIEYAVNTSVSTFKCTDSVWSLERWNDDAHLAGLES